MFHDNWLIAVDGCETGELNHEHSIADPTKDIIVLPDGNQGSLVK